MFRIINCFTESFPDPNLQLLAKKNCFSILNVKLPALSQEIQILSSPKKSFCLKLQMVSLWKNKQCMFSNQEMLHSEW